MSPNTPATVNTPSALDGLFTKREEPTHQIEKGDDSDALECPKLFILGEKGDLNARAREALTTVVEGKPVFPEIGAMFVADREKFTAVSEDAMFYLPDHQLYLRYFQDSEVAGEGERGEIVAISIPKEGQRDPRNKAGKVEGVTTGMMEKVVAVVLIDCPDSGILVAKVMTQGARCRMLKKLNAATARFLDDDYYKKNHGILGLTGPEADARIKEGDFPSLRAGLQTLVSIQQGSTFAYTVWDTDAASISAPLGCLAALEEACGSPSMVECVESLMSHVGFISDKKAELDK